MTAMGTAKSGYIQRKIVKICEDIQIQYDGTVRDTTGKIYQFAYGENGFDATKTVRVDGEPISCDVSRLIEKLNRSHELGLEVEPTPNVDPVKVVTETTLSSTSSRTAKLVKEIKQTYPNTIVDEDWSVQELQQRLKALKVEDAEDKALDEKEEEDTLAEASVEEEEDLAEQEDEASTEEDEVSAEEDEASAEEEVSEEDESSAEEDDALDEDDDEELVYEDEAPNDGGDDDFCEAPED